MAANRREFVLGTPFCIAALLGEAGIAPEVAAAAQAHDSAALDFWTRGMGVSTSAIPSASTIVGIQDGGVQDGGKGASGPSSVQAFAQEPLFLHYYEADKTFIPSDQIPKSYLLKSGNTQLSAQMQRLRLNATDNSRFSRFTSGGIYFELQQAAAAATAAPGDKTTSSGFTQFASTVFSAFMPGAGKGAARKALAAGAPAPKEASPSSAAAGAPIPLQAAKQALSILLPNGAGKAAFSAFVKDPRKTVFGQFLSAMSATPGKDTPFYAQLLTIPLLAYPGLASIRSIVANLQLQGSSQEILMQSPPTDIATTSAAMDALSKPLPLREGDYLVVARQHNGVTIDEINKYKIMDGFLVPKEVTSTYDVTPELVQQAVTALSYLTLAVGVKATTAAPCVAA